MKSIKAIAIAIISALMLGITSCNTDSDGYNTEMSTVMVFATLKSVNTNSCSFTFQEKDDSPEVTVTCAAQLNSNYTVGKRYIVIYLTDNEDPFTSGPVTLQSIVDIYNGDIQSASATQIAGLNNLTVKTATPSRSGEYINVVSESTRGGFTTSEVTYNIYVDETTIDNEIPDAYVVLGSTGTSYTTTTNYYGSFNISSVWNRTTCRGLKVHYTNSSYESAEVTFEKTGIDLVPSTPTE